SEFAAEFFELVLSRFPPESGLSEEQEESVSLRLSRLIREAESAISSAEKAKEATHAVLAAQERSSKIVQVLEQTLKETKAAAAEVAHHREETAKHVADISNAKAQVQADQEAARAAREQI